MYADLERPVAISPLAGELSPHDRRGATTFRGLLGRVEYTAPPVLWDTPAPSRFRGLPDGVPNGARLQLPATPPIRPVKIIDRYVLREHAGPLLFALSALTSLLLLNYISRQFARLVGRGLPWDVIAEFFLLSLPFVIAMTLPMAVLVSTLYAFSRLAAEAEITALKASGVSMPRLLLPVLIAASMLAIGMVWFNDQVLPYANHRLATLQQDIARVKPTFALREQVINTVSEGRLHLSAERIAQSSSSLYGVRIYDLSQPQRRRTIYADSGEIVFAPNEVDIVMTLYDGEIQETMTQTQNAGNLQRIFFDTDVIRVQGVANALQRSDTTGYKSDREMTVCEMRDRALSASAERERARLQLERTLREATRALALGEPATMPSIDYDTTRGRIVERAGLGTLYCRHVADLLTPSALGAQEPGAGAPPVQQISPGDVTGQEAGAAAYALSSGAVSGNYSSPLGVVESTSAQLIDGTLRMNAYLVEIEKKFALAAACVVFVLLGAPLALRFPRGGVGLVIGASIVVFAIYYVGLIAGEALGDRGSVHPLIAMWGANIIFTIVGLLLLARMGRESGSARGGDLGEVLGEWRRKLALRFGRGAAERRQGIA